MWLLSAEIKQALEQAYHSGALPSFDQRAEYSARYSASAGGDSSRVLTIAGDVAQINVSGVITKAPDLIAMIFGGGNVTYSDIVAALAEAEAAPEIARIEMRIDSGGGTIDGLFDTVAAMQSAKKPIRAVIQNQAQSAAYALASQADEIVASNKAVRVGSVGIVASLRIDDTRVDVTSTNAPNKRPDPTTSEGQAVIRQELDALHALFVEAIAEGRGTSPDKVNADFGQGSTLLAEEAVRRGMIDTVAGAPLRVVKSPKATNSASSGGNDSEVGPMDINTLKAQHPDVYAAAVAEGTNQERDRVSAHLTMGAASGDMETALAAVKDGSGMTASLQAQYMAAGMNRKDQERRQQDDETTGAAANGAAGADTGAESESEAVAAIVERTLGLHEEA